MSDHFNVNELARHFNVNPKRYDIISSQDIQDAAKRIEAYHRKQEDKGKVIPFLYSKAQNE